MRVKINASNYGVGKLEFGKKYVISYAGVTYSETFCFTRKNTIEMCEIIKGKKVSSNWISKKVLKQIIRSGAVHWMAEVVTHNGAVHWKAKVN